MASDHPGVRAPVGVSLLCQSFSEQMAVGAVAVAAAALSDDRTVSSTDPRI